MGERKVRDFVKTMMEILENILQLLIQLLKKYWIFVGTSGILGFFIRYLIKLLIDDWILNTLKKAGKHRHKQICFLDYIKAHPSLIPVVLFFFILTILGVKTYFDIRKPPEIPAPIPETTQDESRQKDSVLDIPDCVSRKLPELPCNWVALESEGDSPKTIAENAYDDIMYTLIIVNFNRDDNGFRAITSGKLYLPSIEDFLYPPEPIFPTIDKYPKYYIKCEPLGEKPCYYYAIKGDTYSSIANDYYGFESAKTCIEIANFTFDLENEELKLLSEENIVEKMLLLPKRIIEKCP